MLKSSISASPSVRPPAQSDCAERRSREGSKAVTRTTFGEREQSSEG
jgi:hypothetical protein